MGFICKGHMLSLIQELQDTVLRMQDAWLATNKKRATRSFSRPDLFHFMLSIITDTASVNLSTALLTESASGFLQTTQMHSVKAITIDKRKIRPAQVL